jgi:hypothetical protein
MHRPHGEETHQDGYENLIEHSPHASFSVCLTEISSQPAPTAQTLSLGRKPERLPAASNTNKHDRFVLRLRDLP